MARRDNLWGSRIMVVGKDHCGEKGSHWANVSPLGDGSL
jgi:hypothetical protein